MPPAARVLDLAQNPADAHGCPACPHPVIGPIKQGSDNVFTNGLNAARKTDPGFAAPCCNQNSFEINAGSASVFINDKPAARLGDATKHCGGMGTIINGSPNVMIGDAGGGGGSGSASTGGGVGKSTLKAADLAPTSQPEDRKAKDPKKADDVTSVGPDGKPAAGGDTPPAPPAPGSETLIEVQVVNASNVPQANVFYELTLPDKTTRSGTTGADGFIRLSVSPQKGEVTVRLPDNEPPESSEPS